MRDLGPGHETTARKWIKCHSLALTYLWKPPPLHAAAGSSCVDFMYWSKSCTAHMVISQCCRTWRPQLRSMCCCHAPSQFAKKHIVVLRAKWIQRSSPPCRLQALPLTKLPHFLPRNTRITWHVTFHKHSLAYYSFWQKGKPSVLAVGLRAIMRVNTLLQLEDWEYVKANWTRGQDEASPSMSQRSTYRMKLYNARNILWRFPRLTHSTLVTSNSNNLSQAPYPAARRKALVGTSPKNGVDQLYKN